LGQIDDMMQEIKKRIAVNERVMIVTLTIKMAEDLTAYLKGRASKSPICITKRRLSKEPRSSISLRKGKYDVLVGINLLREGLDIPEVSLICILDADKEGFLTQHHLAYSGDGPGRPQRPWQGHHVRRRDHPIDERMHR
jgi:excinuclease ABC subunit B